MNLQIHSFESIENLAKESFPPYTALISIGDPGSQPPRLSHRPAWKLRLEFDDIYPEEIKEDTRGKYILFDYAMAEKIAEFVYRHKDEAKLFICQCEYGQSRSAAVAAAIAEHFDENGIRIFADERYYPNKIVFALTMQALKRQSIFYT